MGSDAHVIVVGGVPSLVEGARRRIDDLERRWPGMMEHFITRRLPLAEIRKALDERPPDDLKTIIELG